MSIYRGCDIRGIYGSELTDADALAIGRAVGTLSAGREVAVAGDVRLSTPALKAQLLRGLSESGAKALDCGLLPTPAFYFAKKYLGAWGGITVTASHNPPKYNGFKLMLGERPVTTADIEQIGQLALEGSFCAAPGSLRHIEGMAEKYAQHIISLSRRGSLRVVLDAGNGALSLLAPQVFSALGYDVVPLFCEFDGSFPGRDPNPAVYSHLSALQKAVVEAGADMGAAFDGDGDRVVFVDDRGRVIESERALVLMLRTLEPPFCVVYDQKSSSVVREEAQRAGGRAIMERSGHAFIKNTFLNNSSAMAGEISGHFFFRELGGDDGLYAALKMAALLEACGRTLGELADTVRRAIITPDIRLPLTYAQQERVLSAIDALPGERTHMDGVRVQLAHGWLLARSSVTEQALTLRAEADSPDELKKIEALLRGADELLAGIVLNSL